jgi:hypothetical protein
MANGKVLFYYERTRKQQIKVLALNMLLVPFVFWMILLLIKDHQDNDEKLFIVVMTIVILTEVILLSMVIWFLRRPARFFIRLTNYRFSSFHPQFKEWCFSINPFEIVEIEHSTDWDAQSSLITIKMRDGSSHLLCPHFDVDKKQLYQALSSLNSQIITPQKTWLFPSNPI